MSESFDPTATYVVLSDDGGGAEPLPVTDALWDALMSGRKRLDGRLVSAFAFDADMPVWEMHPKGDELLVLVSGTADIVLREDGGERRIRLDERARCGIVPRGTWHRVVTGGVACEIIFITPGEGSEHAPVAP